MRSRNLMKSANQMSLEYFASSPISIAMELAKSKNNLCQKEQVEDINIKTALGVSSLELTLGEKDILSLLQKE